MSNIITRQKIEERIITCARQDESFKQELLNNPKAILAREGFNISDDIQVTVLEETPTHFTVVLPMIPQAQQLSESDLEAVSGGAGKTSGFKIMWD